jgi:sulfur carrier protein
MQITINGNLVDIDNIKNLRDIVNRYCKPNKNAILEMNGAIVPCGLWEETLLHDGDRIELMAFVGGG